MENPNYRLYHHGIIRIIVSAELKKHNKTWEHFLHEFSNSRVITPLVSEVEVSPLLDPPDKTSSENINKSQNSVKVQDFSSPGHGKK